MKIICKKCSTELPRHTEAIHHLRRCAAHGDGRNEYAEEAKRNFSKLKEYFAVEFQDDWSDGYNYQKGILFEGMFSENLRQSVRESLNDIFWNAGKLRDFKASDFKQRMDISGQVTTAGVFYRKMSNAEFDKLNLGGTDPFTPVFSYHNTAYYRYWMSTSLAKVRAFGNEKSTDSGGRIVRITFTNPPRTVATISAHQKTGVQHDTKVVAIHREGFAEIGNINSDAAVNEIYGPPCLDYNLGIPADLGRDIIPLVQKIEEVK